MADPYNYVTLTGTIVPDTTDIQTGVEDEYKSLFGQDLDVDPNTPEGLLISAETLSRKAVVDNNVALANQINPNIAGGIFLDATMALTGSAREPARFTFVSCDLTGVTGTIIPGGSQARDANGILYQTISDITLIGSPGEADDIPFASVEPGAFLCPANTLTQIVTNIIGWETVTNPEAQYTVGAPEMSDVAARQFRRNTLAAQGTSLALAMISELYLTDGVTGVSFRENPTGSTVVIDGVSLVPHSIYACVDGGTDTAVAYALLLKKSGGCAYNNGGSSSPVSETVEVPVSHQMMDVLFDRPDYIDILVRVTVVAGSAIQNPTEIVKKAILDYANGEIDNDPGLNIGTAVSCFELAGAINIQSPGLFVTNLEISLTTIPPVFSNDTIDMTIYQRAIISDSSITVNF